MKIKYTMKDIPKPVLFKVGDKVRIISGYEYDRGKELCVKEEGSCPRLTCISKKIYAGAGYRQVNSANVFEITEEVLANRTKNSQGIIYWFKGLNGIYDYALEKIET